MKFSKSVLLSIFALIIISTVSTAAINLETHPATASPKDRSSAFKKIAQHIEKIKRIDNAPHDVRDTLRHNPALNNILKSMPSNRPHPQPVKDALAMKRQMDILKHTKVPENAPKNIHSKEAPQYITGIEYHDRECKQPGVQLVRYVGCTMAEFETWEAIKFSGMKDENATFYRYNKPACNVQGIPMKSFTKDVCMRDSQNGRFFIWTW